MSLDQIFSEIRERSKYHKSCIKYRVENFYNLVYVGEVIITIATEVQNVEAAVSDRRRFESWMCGSL
jgi:hypothetical protein